MYVEVEALRIVKEALLSFKSDVEGIGVVAISKSQLCIEECQKKIFETEQKVQDFELRVSWLIKEIQKLEQKISFAQNELQRIDKVLPTLEQQLQNLHIQQSELSECLSELHKRLANTENPEKRKQIQEQINLIQRELNSVRDSIQGTDEEISEMKDKKENLKRSIAMYVAQKEEYEQNLSVAKRKLNQYQQKLEELNIANHNVQSDINSYIQCVKKFESSSVESSKNKTRVVDECIDIITDMESVI